MARKRILDLAKELNVEAKEILEHVKRLGFDVRSVSSSLSEDEAMRVMEELKRASGTVAEKRLSGGVIRRRAAGAPPAAAASAPADTETRASEPPAAEPQAPAPEPVVEVATPAPTPQHEPEPTPAPTPVAAPVTAPVVSELPPLPTAPVETAAAPVETAAAPEPISTLPTPAPEAAPAAPVVATPAPVEPAATATPPAGTAAPSGAATATAPAAGAAAAAPGTEPTAPRPLRRRTFQAEIISRPETAEERRRAEIMYRPATSIGERASNAAARSADAAAGRKTTPATARPGTATPRAATPEEESGDAANRSRKRVVQRADLYDSGDPMGFGSALRARKRRVATKKPVRPLTANLAPHKRIIRLTGTIQLSDLAHQMGVKGIELVRKLFSLGTMATVNQSIDTPTAEVLAADYGFTIENVEVNAEDLLKLTPDAAEKLTLRPPVVTIMGHVDHGKTTLLDTIRKTRVAAGEAGGITQHIGAYQVTTGKGPVTFLDTPGHEAFTAMRARGAKATDLVVLVVAADDGIMPQTVEAINHAKAAGVPIIVAINKIDKPDANPGRVKNALMQHELVLEDFGGDVLSVEVSAKAGTNIDQLLETIALQAEVLELKANPNKRAVGTVVEAKLDKGRGPVVTLLVQEGTLKAGDTVVAGEHYGRVRAMTDDLGRRLKEAGPSTPVEVIGLSGVPSAGEKIYAVESDEVAKEYTSKRSETAKKAAEAPAQPKMSLDDFFNRVQTAEVKQLNVVLKTDVQGSLEAARELLAKQGNDEVKVRIIHGGVGAITESDINLASASDAIVLGFHVKPDNGGRLTADREGVDVRHYTVIYEMVDDVKKSLRGMLAPIIRERALGRAEVRQVISIPKIGVIAGSSVLDGVIKRSASVRLVRGGKQIFEGKLDSLKRFKDDVREVKQGFECGIAIANYQDIQVGDIIEAFDTEEIAPPL